MQRGKRVGGFAGLRQRDDQGIFSHYRITVTELAGHFDAARYAGDGFQPVTPDHAGVVAGAAGDDVHALNSVEYGGGIGTECFLQDVVAAQAAFECVGDGARLLEYFLEHVVAIFSALDSVGSQFRNAHRPFHHFALRVVDRDMILAQIGDITILEKDKTLRYGNQRRDIRGNKVFTDADTDHQRTAAPCCHQASWFRGADHAQSIGAMQFRHCGPHRLEQVLALLQMMIYLVHHDFGVRLGGKFITSRSLLGAQ